MKNVRRKKSFQRLFKCNELAKATGENFSIHFNDAIVYFLVIMSVNIEHHEKSGCGQQKTRKFRLLSIVNFHVDVIRHILKLT